MALTDPIEVKEVAKTKVKAARVVSGNFRSVYETSDGLNKITISTEETGSNRKRHLIRFDVSKITTNPYEETKKQEVTASMYLVIDRPIAGYTIAELAALLEGFNAFTSSGTEYEIAKRIMGGES
jgi:hypothetical protein